LPRRPSAPPFPYTTLFRSAMLKPSELAPASAEAMARMLAEAFDAEEVAVVLGGAATGAAFAGLPFDHLVFTGSTEVGRRVLQAADRKSTRLNSSHVKISYA